MESHNRDSVFYDAIRNARKVFVKEMKRGNRRNIIPETLNAAQKSVQKRKNEHYDSPRVIPIPKTGGFLPFLIPLFAGLSALGGLAGGAAGIAKAVNDAKSAKLQLLEAQRHNKNMEAIALGKRGDGLYLGKHKNGLGLFLKPRLKKNFQ